MSTLTEYPTIFDPEEAPDEAGKAKTMKSMFLARWQLKGRTPQTLYMEWQNLKFDPAKDDIEDFCNDVKNLANRLGYPEDAQVMAIKATLPPVLVMQVINVKHVQRNQRHFNYTGRKSSYKESLAHGGDR